MSGKSIVWRVLAGLAVVLVTAWGGLALYYQLPGGRWGKGLATVLWVASALAALYALFARPHWGRRAGWLYALLVLVLLGWWHSLQPSNDRVWADDVARMLGGSHAGSVVRLENVRNFQWRTDDDYTVRWENRSYDLDELESVDMVLSTWGMPAIAHTLVSFGFSDGQHVVFSVEIRKEKHEKFSEIGGFFKEFELSVVAADERDIIYVRTAVRGEQVAIYPISMSRQAMRELFLAYVDTANGLREQPRFYHTVTANCTTLVYQMARAIVPGLPMDYRLLLSGYLPEYLYAHGGLDHSQSLEQIRQHADITARAARVGNTPEFSRAIRQP
ncbi:Lnb N-terminal periplasmic domain-containing protein [Bordetella genomosp. 12]|uniref:Lnb N-terminal periplasmic domain-containing protein n=1 Tax=Bordetella genomosp. 12 TaxID=463035 RepID=A0A261V9M1_9BORD|nr:DUF4105 domain-containing protein [Bordetella genomosp. 12]OZI70819.1 hypothetical protein CAL22_13010 [Bordetella genomosp. 12]